MVRILAYISRCGSPHSSARSERRFEPADSYLASNESSGRGWQLRPDKASRGVFHFGKRDGLRPWSLQPSKRSELSHLEREPEGYKLSLGPSFGLNGTITAERLKIELELWTDMPPG